MSWTDERIATLTKMWESGATASQIADELGGVSRNAVIGKAHRLGLKARPSPVKANEPKPTPRKEAEARTGKPIPRTRLEAIPWTRFTVQAQAQLERDGALRQECRWNSCRRSISSLSHTTITTISTAVPWRDSCATRPRPAGRLPSASDGI